MAAGDQHCPTVAGADVRERHQNIHLPTHEPTCVESELVPHAPVNGSAIIVSDAKILNTTKVLSDTNTGFNNTNLEVYWKFEETSGILTTEDFANINDADSINDSGINKTNTGVFGNAWRTADSGSTFVNITGTVSDWDFIQSGSHSYNLWMQVPDQITVLPLECYLQHIQEEQVMEDK